LFYIQDNRDHAIFAQLKGKIAIELMSTDRHVHNLELLTAKDAAQFRQKLNEIYNPPFCVLSAKPEMEFNKNNVTLSFLTSVEGSKVTYTINVSPDAPRKLKGSLKPKTISGALDLGGRRYKYAADLEFLVEVVEKQGAKSWLGGQFAEIGKGLKNDFSDGHNQKEIAKGFGAAGIVAAISVTAVAVKAYAIFDVATGGPVTTTAMVAAGTPAGQKVLMEFLPSMNPSELPSPTWFGYAGYKVGSKIEKALTQ
jgi:hypothetical protein